MNRVTKGLWAACTNGIGGRGGGRGREQEQVSAARGGTWRVNLAASRTVWKKVTSP